MRAVLDTWDKLGIAGELFGFLWRMKMWWLMPMVLVLVLLGVLISFGSASGVGPFIYTLFYRVSRTACRTPLVLPPKNRRYQPRSW